MVQVAIFIALLTVAVAIFIVLTKRERGAFRQRFPPISDAEFVAHCTPGTNPKVALRVRRVMADCLGVEYERIYPSSRIAQDLGAE